jgi:lysophospholipid acyltransferase (LPLAT)-like uncharacterized protein
MSKLSFSDRLRFALAPVLAEGVIRALHRTHRSAILREEHAASFWQAGKNIIIAFWHDQLLMMPKGYRGPGARILISSSRDGELIARTMHRFGFGTVRGSSTRGGSAALRELIMMAREPVDLVMTPDGPKGPRHQIKEGVAALARLTGRPIVPLTFVTSRGYRFASWDRFLLSYPGAQTAFRYGEPILCARDEGDESCRLRIQAGMEENLSQARLYLESHGLRAV